MSSVQQVCAPSPLSEPALKREANATMTRQSITTDEISTCNLWAWRPVVVADCLDMLIAFEASASPTQRERVKICIEQGSNADR